MIDARAGMREIQTMKRQGYTENMLAAIICELLMRHNSQSGKPLNKIESFYVGLRYSEFLAQDNTDMAYYVAEIKKQEYLNALGVDGMKLNKLCEKFGYK